MADREMASPHLKLLVLTLCLVQFIDVLGTAIIIIALPAIQADLGLGASERELVAGIYALLFGSLLLLAGRLADAWGPKKVFQLGLLVFGVTSLIAGTAGSSVVLLGGRAGQGIGAALAVPAALAMIASAFPVGEARNRALAAWAIAGAVGGGAAFALGGFITDAFGWRWTILGPLPFVVLAAVVIQVIDVPEAPHISVAIPLLQSAWLTAGLLLFTFGLSNSQIDGVAVTTVLTPVIAGCALLILFMRGERGPRPLVPLQAWRDRSLWTGTVVGFVLTFTTTSGAVLITLFLQQIKGRSATTTGWILIPFSVAVVIASPIGSRLVSTGGATWPMIGGLAGVAVSFIGLIAALETSSIPLMAGSLFVQGLALGITTVASTSRGLENSTETDQGTAAGMLNAGARIGTSLGIAVIGALAAVVTSGRGDEGDRSTILGYQTALLASVIVTGVAMLAVHGLSKGSQGVA